MERVRKFWGQSRSKVYSQEPCSVPSSPSVHPSVPFPPHPLVTMWMSTQDRPESRGRHDSTPLSGSHQRFPYLRKKGVPVCPEEMGGGAVLQFQSWVEGPFSLALCSSDSFTSFAPILQRPHIQVCPPTGRRVRGMGRWAESRNWGDWEGALLVGSKERASRGFLSFETPGC